MQSKKSNVRWLIKLIFLGVLVVGLFFSWQVWRTAPGAVLAQLGLACSNSGCNCQSRSSSMAVGCAMAVSHASSISCSVGGIPMKAVSIKAVSTQGYGGWF
jgi:hypothetical protein